MTLLKLLSEKKQYISDFAYTVGSSLLLQAVLHLVIHPYINFRLGAEALGNIVFYMSIIYIFAQSFGHSLCQTRQVVRKDCQASNGDYNVIISVILLLSAVFGGLIGSFYLKGTELVFFVAILLFTVLRYYATVEYRLKLNFKLCLVFFSILSVGYLVGAAVFTVTSQWYYVFLVGEAAVVIVFMLRGTIFKPETRTGNIPLIAKATASLGFSYLLVEITTNADRLILKNFIDAEAVSLFYVVSLIGKTLLMFVGPINNMTLSYASSGKKHQTKKGFLKTFTLYTAISLVFYLFCIVGTPIFVKLFYPNLYSQMQGLNLIVNAAQVINFAASLPIILILVELGSSYHLKVNLLFAVLYIPSAMLMTHFFGIWGYAWATVIVNIIRYVEVLLLGLLKFPKENSPKEMTE